MDKLKHLYVKVSNFIEDVKSEKDFDKLLKELSKINSQDTFQRVRNVIKIEEDWILYIESKMKYVEAAIYENRQFIRDDGEVLPIERVKKISKNSIEHLARHSDYIDKYKEGEELVPSKLYTVSKDTDYGVYENKFLYLVLNTINDFIQKQREDIQNSLKGCNGELSLIRKNEMLEDEICVELKMTFTDLYLEGSISDSEAEKITKMDEIRSKSEALLRTPLMQIISQEPMISSTITKTNVLTMNENFSNALELYEYLINYDTKSYRVEKVPEDIVLRNEFSYPVLALELLAQAYKNQQIDSYSEYLETYKKEQRKIELDRINLEIEKIKKEHMDDFATYIEYLEDKMSLLEEDNKQIALLEAERNTLLGKIKDIQFEKKNILLDMDALNQKIKEYEVKQESIDLDKQAIKDEYEAILMEKDEALTEGNKELEEAQRFLDKLSRDVFQRDEKINALKEELLEEMKTKEELEKNLLDEMASLREQNQKLSEEKEVLSSFHLADQILAGKLDPQTADTSKEGFNELERLYTAFTTYFEDVWKKTKKEIKKEIKKETRKKG